MDGGYVESVQAEGIASHCSKKDCSTGVANVSLPMPLKKKRGPGFHWRCDQRGDITQRGEGVENDESETPVSSREIRRRLGGSRELRP